MLSSAGFTNVRVEDRSKQFVDVLKGELGQTEKNKEKFIAVSYMIYIKLVVQLVIIIIIICFSHQFKLAIFI